LSAVSSVLRKQKATAMTRRSIRQPRSAWPKLPIALLLGIALLPTRLPAGTALATGAGAGPSAARLNIQIAELEAGLQSPDEEQRRSVVRKLAELNRPEAWRLVVRSLADESSRVADEAQIRLPGIDPGNRERLQGKDGLESDLPLVRERVAEALGRFAEAQAQEFTSALNDKSAEVRRLACYSLERLALRGALLGVADAKGRAALNEVERLARKDRDSEVRAAAWVVHLLMLAPSGAGAQDPATEEPGNPAAAGAQDADAGWPSQRAWDWLDTAQADKEISLRGAAGYGLGLLASVLALGREDGQHAQPAAAAWYAAQETRLLQLGALLLADRERSVRLAGVRGLTQYPSRAVLAAWIERLKVESDGIVQSALVGALQGASGLFHRTDTRPWERWLEGLASDYFGQRARGEPTDDDGETSARLVGLPIPPGPVAFLIDMSGSMWDKDDQGRTMKELVDGELARCLEALKEGNDFLLVPYATEPQPYDDRLTTVTPKKVAAAIDWFKNCKLRGKGNLWDAVQVVRASERVPTLVIFSDGAPTGGPHWEMELMVDLLLEQHRFRGTVFHAVLTDQPSKRVLGAWQRLCSQTGGRLAEARFQDK
jgi:HEAT repeats